MRNFKHNLFFIILLGFFLIPSNVKACGIKSDKSCYKTETFSKSEKNDCCKSKHSKNKDNSCGGKCGHSNCTSSTSINFSLLSDYDFAFKNNSFDFSTLKLQFYQSETFISSGFYSIWLIPKIG